MSYKPPRGVLQPMSGLVRRCIRCTKIKATVSSMTCWLGPFSALHEHRVPPPNARSAALTYHTCAVMPRAEFRKQGLAA